ncbi:hypothetical protein [Streptomyces sp. NPDC101115]|uniref:hypothetical protein n=1 Tax=Streptomyces sp. NPDC101115 TaxID=3366106 RepID=UPI0037FDD3C5
MPPLATTPPGIHPDIAAAITSPQFMNRLMDALEARRAAVARRPALPLARAVAAPQRPAPAPKRPPVRLRSAPTLTASAPLPPMPADAFSVATRQGWKWARVGIGIPDGDSWARLLRELVAAGPLMAIDTRRARDDKNMGTTMFHESADGLWADVVIASDLDHHQALATLGHELGHVADEIGRLNSGIPIHQWRATLARGADPHTEAVADDVARWLTPTTSAAELIEACAHYRATGRPHPKTLNRT